VPAHSDKDTLSSAGGDLFMRWTFQGAGPLTFAALVCLFLPSPADASVILITNRPGLGSPQQTLNWGTLGGPFTTVRQPFSINSSPDNIPATVSQPSGPFERRDQGNGWSGNFNNGEQLLWNQGNGPTLTIDLGSNGAMSGGANIQADFFGAFTAKLE